jgi:uncharacterized phage protein (TIGR02220 family)
MAIKRMFSMKIVDADAFLDMPLSSQALYFHLAMRADDDGFIGNHKRIMRTINCSDDDLKILFGKRFIIPFESGVCVIKHWKMHNTIQNDRYSKTNYLTEFNQLKTKENKSYKMIKNIKEEKMETKCIQDVSVGLDKGLDLDLGLEDTFIPPKEKKETIPYNKILLYLNTKTGKISLDKKFQYGRGKKTDSYIKQRWEEGIKNRYTYKDNLDRFYLCIDNTYLFRMADDGDLTYMKPSTIFNGEMESRVNNSLWNWFYNKKSNNHNQQKEDELNDKYGSDNE